MNINVSYHIIWYDTYIYSYHVILFCKEKKKNLTKNNYGVIKTGRDVACNVSTYEDVACNVSTMDIRVYYLIHLNIFLVETSGRIEKSK